MSVVSHLDFHCALNKVYISGLIGIENFRVLLAAIYGLVHKQGYDEIVLDFSNCTAAFPGAMLPVCCFCLQAQDEGVKFSLILPVAGDEIACSFERDPQLSKLPFPQTGCASCCADIKSRAARRK